MKKRIYILLLSFFTSCSSGQNLEGTWVGAYSYLDNANFSMNSPIRSVITFRNDKYFFKSFKFDFLSTNSSKTGKYNYSKNTINYIPNSGEFNISEAIQLVNEDSLIIKGKNGANNTVYRKINNLLKNKSGNIKLAGKRFLLKTKDFMDTLYFENDTLITSTNNPHIKRWEKINHQGFNILFIEDFIPLVIHEKINNKISLTGFYKKRQNFELIEIQ